MKKYVYIAIGGMLGAMSRFGIENINLWDFQNSFPVQTLLVNITGSFFLLLFLTTALEALHVDANLRLGIATGFLGAYTTFSTLCKETVSLLFAGYYMTAIFYILSSAVLGLAAAYFGVLAGRKMIEKLTGKNFISKFDEKSYKEEVE